MMPVRPNPPHVKSNSGPLGFSIDCDKPAPRMIKGQFLDDIREAAFAVLVLAVHVSGDTAADRQKRIAGQEPEP